MYRTKEPAVQKFLIATINRPLVVDVQQAVAAHALETGETIWSAGYDQAMQDFRVGPYAGTPNTADKDA